MDGAVASTAFTRPMAPLAASCAASSHPVHAFVVASSANDGEAGRPTKVTQQQSTLRLLVLSSKEAPELEVVIRRLPSAVLIVGIGRTPGEFAHLADADWASIDAVLNCGWGKHAARVEDIQVLWPRLTGVRWLHSASSGVDHLMFKELVEGPVTLTNAQGVYSHSLAEYALAACNWFAKDLPRLAAQQAARQYEPYEVEELRGKTMGIVGYGDIGQACGRLAKAYGMRVIALRRRAELSADELAGGELDGVFPPPDLHTLLQRSDYVVMATPYTPATHMMMGTAALAAMKPTAVFVNIGRGKCVDEEALIDALRAGRLRGAALDVFATEPLPQDSPLWAMRHVLISPHCMNRTRDFQLESLSVFLDNVERYLAGKPLANVRDKSAGY